MTATEATAGLWGMMRQRWLESAAEPRDAQLREDIGRSEVQAEPAQMPLLVHAWRR
ncbi:hypothetical protein [Belnapia moabensis]|uniref:hypothetical protein n=1 Tax=Belnapia moabensis TaxID=365533 RepID=UPI0012EE0CA3|nr:hypothetical protein [Belnapia moabensis]